MSAKPEEEKPRVYTITETAKILKVTRNTIYNQMNAGKIKAVKIGKCWRIPAETLEDYIRNGIS